MTQLWSWARRLHSFWRLGSVGLFVHLYWRQSPSRPYRPSVTYPILPFGSPQPQFRYLFISPSVLALTPYIPLCFSSYLIRISLFVLLGSPGQPSSSVSRISAHRTSYPRSLLSPLPIRMAPVLFLHLRSSFPFSSSRLSQLPSPRTSWSQIHLLLTRCLHISFL